MATNDQFKSSFVASKNYYIISRICEKVFTDTFCQFRKKFTVCSKPSNFMIYEIYPELKVREKSLVECSNRGKCISSDHSEEMRK